MMKRISIAGLSLILILSINVEAQNTSDKTKAKTTKDNNGSKLSIGGYGEVLYRNYDYGLNPMGSTSGAVKEDRATIDIPRFIISLDYDFGSGFSLATEIEFEHGGTGSAIEYEFDEMGEYEAEIEKGGEVVLEQFHLTKRFSNAFSLRVGHIILGVGQINQHHLPSEYFTTVRPEAESSILPSTWHETGLEVSR